MRTTSFLLFLFSLPASAQEAAGPGVEDLRAHYARVEEELRARDTSGLSPEVRARREALIAELARYREAADFTRSDEPGVRAPVFVDAEGRHCAVASLLRFTDEQSLVARVAGSNNGAWAADLAADLEFRAWLDEVGLTFEEAARIQAPAIPRPIIAVPGAGSPTGPSLPGPMTPGGGAPAPTTPSGPMTPGGAAQSPATFAGEIFTDWMLWWEFNKLEWIRPNPLARGKRPANDDMTWVEGPLESARRDARALLIEELSSDHASVRAAAAVALARAVGADAVEDLRALLQDPARHVRLAAIAALAATDSEEGVYALLEIVASDEEPGPGLRAAAVVALGAARAEGAGEGVERILPALVREEGDDEGYALFVYPSLAPSAMNAGLVGEAKARSGLYGRRNERSDEATLVSAQAVSALRFAPAAETLPRLLDAVGGRRLELRRSAALALGEVEGALEPLMTAYELEGEALARGYLLTSIGRHGGDQARAFLKHELEHGKSTLRPWCALALGLAAAADDDEGAREALRKGLANEKSRVTRGAFLLALGIAKDAKAEPLLVLELRSKNALQRSYAAQALGLVGGEGARAALRSLLAYESTSIVRATAAQALALLGDERDAELLLAELANARDPMLRAQIAVAVGSHGTDAAVDGLLASLRGKELRGESRAAALGGLAIALSGRDAMTLGAASARADYTAFPSWLLELLQHPL